MLEKGRVGEVYNIGGHNEKANIEIVKIILKELGKPKSLITYVKDRKGHVLRYAIAPNKAMKELGWQSLPRCSKMALSKLFNGTKIIWIGWQSALVAITRNFTKRFTGREKR